MDARIAALEKRFEVVEGGISKILHGTFREKTTLPLTSKNSEGKGNARRKKEADATLSDFTKKLVSKKRHVDFVVRSARPD